MAFTSGTVHGFKQISDGTSGDWKTSGYIGVGSNSTYNTMVACVEFTIDSATEVLKLDFTTYSTAYVADFYWAITSAEDSAYESVDSANIGEGNFGIKSSSTHTAYTHKLFKALDAGTYYLYIWSASESTSASSTTMHGFNISYGLYSDLVGEVDVRNYYDGEVYLCWNRCFQTSAGSLEIPCGGYNGYNWVSVFRFVTDSRAKNPVFSFCVVKSSTTTSGSVRYKVVSEKEDYSLKNADSTTECDGVFTIPSSLSDYERLNFTISDKHLNKGVHYLYIWTNSTNASNNLHVYWIDDQTNTYAPHITYEEANAVIYIDNGTSFDAYEVYIDNGTSWDLYAAYIDNGSSWDECG